MLDKRLVGYATPGSSLLDAFQQRRIDFQGNRLICWMAKMDLNILCWFKFIPIIGQAVCFYKLNKLFFVFEFRLIQFRI